MAVDAPQYFNGAFLKKDAVLYRQYQHSVFEQCKDKNSLVVLPTGLGKTVVGVLSIANRLKKYPRSKIIILAPTRPLISQHRASCEKFLSIDKEKIVALTGKTSPEKRFLSYQEARIIVSTPQVIINDLRSGRYDLKNVSLVIFDESHRTKGNYPYFNISKQYIKECSDPLVLGLTASPGKDHETIQQLCENLYIENIVFKTYEDEDVKDYVYPIDTLVEKVDLTKCIYEISQVWENLFRNFLRFFIERELINPYKKYYSKLDFLRISHDLTQSLANDQELNACDSDSNSLLPLYFQNPRIIDVIKKNKIDIHSVFSYCSSCISILHAKDLLETQDTSLFKSFLDGLKFKAENDLLSAKRIVNSEHFKFVNSAIEKDNPQEWIHPKIIKLISVIKDEFKEFNNKRFIIFCQYREMAELLKTKLKQELNNEYLIEKCIGQTTKEDDCGYSQQVQLEIIEQFRSNKIDIMVATSVAEEGLDIPNVDAVIFYEPIPSEIRLIQRRGRTGRFSPGRCYILVAESTVDEPYCNIAFKKEDSMHSVLKAPEELNLVSDITRKKIKLPSDSETRDKFELLKEFNERKEKEKEILANRSIEDIISELDKFSKSEEYNKLKDFGVTFYNDVIKLDRSKMMNSILKFKRKNIEAKHEVKQHLSICTRTLINIASTYSENGKIMFSEFQSLARDENIIEEKFYNHLNQACYQGFLKREGNYIKLLRDSNS